MADFDAASGCEKEGGLYESLTHSLPLARPSRASGFARIPFAASQAAQVESSRNLTNLQRDFEEKPSRLGLRRTGKRVAGAAGLEPVTSAVTGQRSNQLSYAPAWGSRTYGNTSLTSSGTQKNIRAADAKEVGVGNPAEETYCYPNNEIVCPRQFLSTPSLLMLISLMDLKNVYSDGRLRRSAIAIAERPAYDLSAPRQRILPRHKWLNTK